MYFFAAKIKQPKQKVPIMETTPVSTSGANGGRWMAATKVFGVARFMVREEGEGGEGEEEGEGEEGGEGEEEEEEEKEEED